MKKILTATALVGAGLILATSAVNAYRGDPNVTGPNHTPERHEAMTQAFLNNDYNAWKALMADRPMGQRITEENFGKFVEMRNLRHEGKIDEANQIRAELGFGLRNGSGKNMAGGFDKLTTSGQKDGQGYKGGLK
ncbi:MAG: hypothetical protein ABIJ43_02710 [Candidatus Beckwithbacteria bacterium]|nr:hypothetical protein [Patescibacteria group bacterium]